MNTRRKGRLLAVQALYEADTTTHDAVWAVTRLAGDMRVSEEVERFARRLVEGVVADREAVDALIAEAASAWPLSEMAVVDRNILRLATWELIRNNDAPVKAVVNEAIELAKLLGSDSSARFVNGVLGYIVDKAAARSAPAGPN